MENKVRRTEIQIETHEVKIVRLQKRHALALCDVCSEIVTVLTPEQTAEILEMAEEEVLCLLENGRVHPVNAERGKALICGNSFGSENGFVTRKALSTSVEIGRKK